MELLIFFQAIVIVFQTITIVNFYYAIKNCKKLIKQPKEKKSLLEQIKEDEEKNINKYWMDEETFRKINAIINANNFMNKTNISLEYNNDILKVKE